MKKIITFISMMLFYATAYMIFLPSIVTAQMPALPPYATTCLPSRERMSPLAGTGAVALSDTTCHCPPSSYCSNTGVTALPKNIKDICCTTTPHCSETNTCPLPPPPPTHDIPKACEVHYYKDTPSKCADKTFIGTRVAPYCTEYTPGTVPSATTIISTTPISTTTTDCVTSKTTQQCYGYPPNPNPPAIPFTHVSSRTITQSNIPNCLACAPTTTTSTLSSINDPLTGVTTTTTRTTTITCSTPPITVTPASPVSLPSFTNLSDIKAIPLPTAIVAPTVPYPIRCNKAVPTGGFLAPDFTCTQYLVGCVARPNREVYNTIKRTETITETITETTNRIPALNTCLASCETHRLKIRNYSTTATLPSGLENSDERERYHMQPQIWLKDFVTCRRTCFQNNGFNDGDDFTTGIPIMTNNEANLNKWIMLPLSDNVTDAQVLSGTNERDALQTAFSKSNWRETAEHIKFFVYKDSQITHFTAKTYGPLVHTVVNQWDGSPLYNPYINGFVNNTYTADRIYYASPFTAPNRAITAIPSYELSLGLIDTQISVSYAPTDGNKSQEDYFYRQILGIPSSNKFTNISLSQNLNNLRLDTNVSGPLPQRFGCAKWAYIGMCITTWANNGSCNTCIAPETQVTMYDGTTKAIKDLKIGDRVKALHGKDAEIEDITELDWQELSLYNVNNGLLRLTADHPVMTKAGWRAINYDIRNDNNGYGRYGIKKVKTLKIGDILITDNSAIAVTHIMPESPVKNGKTFNLKLKNSKGFYANGVWVRTQN